MGKVGRFEGTVERVGRCDPELVGMARGWAVGIPFEEWPQQDRLKDGKIRPAFISDLSWRGFGKVTDELVSNAMTLSGAKHDVREYNRMVSVVMPGHSIDPHVDRQTEGWLFRMHVPLATNDRSWFIVDELFFHGMDFGAAYKVNTTRTHGVRNEGSTPRIHLMFDVGR